MKYSTMLNLISKQLGDELVSESEMLGYMDRVIDDINAQLNATFPTFTDYKEANAGTPDSELDYRAIPDKYIRTVVIPGTAFKYYTTDEEGGYSAPKYEEDYNNGLFYMLRDYSFSIPAEYRADDQGYVETSGDFDTPGITIGNRGIW